MLNVNNTITSKIIALIVAVSFLLTDISYAGAYQQGSLRVPMGEKSTYGRIGEAQSPVTKSDKRGIAAILRNGRNYLLPVLAALGIDTKNPAEVEVKSEPFLDKASGVGVRNTQASQSTKYLDKISEAIIQEKVKQDPTVTEFDISIARNITRDFDSSTREIILSNVNLKRIAYSDWPHSSLLSIIKFFERGEDKISKDDAKKFWEALSGKPYDLSTVIMQYQTKTGVFNIKDDPRTSTLESCDSVYNLLVNLSESSIPLDFKIQCLKAIRNNGWPLGFSYLSDFENIYKVSPPRNSNIWINENHYYKGLFFLVNLYSSLNIPLDSRFTQAILSSEGGIYNILKRIVSEPDLIDKIIGLKIALINFTAIADFTTGWNKHDLSSFLEGVILLKQLTGLGETELNELFFHLQQFGIRINPGLPEKLLNPPEDTLKTIFKHLGDSEEIRFYLKIMLDKKNDLMVLFLQWINEVETKLKLREYVKPEDFNAILFAASLTNLPGEQKAGYIQSLYDFTVNEVSPEMKVLHSYSILGAIEQLDEKTSKILDSNFPNIQRTLKPLVNVESLPYKEIFGPKNPNKEFNIRAYIPFDSENYKTLFVNELGMVERQEGDKVTLIGVLNGKKITIYLDTTGNPKDYKGEIFKDMGDPNIHMILYCGHTGMGGSLAFALDRAPAQDILQTGTKLIAVLSCSSAQSYLGPITIRYPYSQQIFTISRASDAFDTPVLKIILQGITKEKNWAEISEEAKAESARIAKTISSAEGGRPKEAAKYLFPDESRLPFFSNLGRGYYIPISGVVLLTEEDSFDFKPGNVDLSKVVSNKPKEVIQKVQYFFSWNDVLGKFSTQIYPASFSLPPGDEEKVFFLSAGTSQTKYNISLNLGYRNSSKAALTMMLLYELNEYFSKTIVNTNGQVNIFDKLRGLQMVAEFVKTHHKGHLFPEFLKKYGYDETKVPLNLLLDTLDSNDNQTRTKALNILLENMGYKQKLEEKGLKSHGLLSYNSDNWLDRMGIDDLEPRIASDGMPYWYYTGDWGRSQASDVAVAGDKMLSEVGEGTGKTGSETAEQSEAVAVSPLEPAVVPARFLVDMLSSGTWNSI